MVCCSIIIVNYNTQEITNECIVSIQQFTKDIDYEIILIDNNSADGSRDFFKNYKGITFIQAPENLGFGRANNLGAKKATGKYLLFLNSDTLLYENSIKKMAVFFEEKKDELQIGSLGCILVDQQMKFNGAGNELPTCRKEIANYRSLLPVIRSFSKKPQPPQFDLESEYFEMGYVIGADLMVMRNVFEKLEGFDPAYFMYYEETDLQKRMKDMHLKSWIYTGTKIIHLEEGSGKKIKNYNNRKRIIVHKSRNIYLKKNDPQNFWKYRLWDKLYLTLASQSSNYTNEENLKYYLEIKKTHL